MNLSGFQSVRYIRQGSGLETAKYCLENGMCYIGFGTDDDECFQLALEASNGKGKNRWDEVWRYQFKKNFSSSEQAGRFRATSATNQLRTFFEADESTLWVTFYGGKLHYGIINSQEKPVQSSDFEGTLRHLQSPWSCRDVMGQELNEMRLSGRLTQIKSFRGTSCELKPDLQKYVIRKIGCELEPYQAKVDKALTELQAALVEAIKTFTPDDFELLVELIFSRTMQRRSITGGNMQYADIVFKDPIKLSDICVQVKSTTNLEQFKKYLEDPYRQNFDTFYYVYHSAPQSKDAFEDLIGNDTEASEVVVQDVEDIAKLSIESGLVSWIMERAG